MIARSTTLSTLTDIARSTKDIRSCRRTPGYPFAKFGQRIGLSLLASGKARLSLEYLISPVISVRYFEVPFAYGALPTSNHGRWLDVSSPRIFPLYVLQNRSASMEVWNPDRDDLSTTVSIAKLLRLDGITPRPASVDELSQKFATFDCITSISVIEHISGQYDDRQAVRWMSESLRPGGRLILTVPTAQIPYDEYRDSPVYPTQEYVEGRGYFFQRWYDEDAIRQRIIDSLVNMQVHEITYCGERESGTYGEYQLDLERYGRSARTRDASWFRDQFVLVNEWSQIPGMGVCGIVATKR